MKRVDLNADLGEGCANDGALLSIVTSANIACGWHAGDEQTMRDTIRAAHRHGVAIGAHPSFPDRKNFGRTNMVRSPADIYSDVVAQVETLRAIAGEVGATLRHVKAHGALYNMASRDREMAEAIVRAVRDVDANLYVYGLAGSEVTAAARVAGLRAIEEIFADRRYTRGGDLVPRSLPGALIEDEDEAASQALSMIANGAGETVCVHGDTPQAVTLARTIRARLIAAGVDVAPP